MAEFAPTIRSYARKAVGLVDEDDSKSVQMVGRALAPVGEAKSRRRSASKASEAPASAPGDVDTVSSN